MEVIKVIASQTLQLDPNITIKSPVVFCSSESGTELQDLK